MPPSRRRPTPPPARRPRVAGSRPRPDHESAPATDPAQADAPTQVFPRITDAVPEPEAAEPAEAAEAAEPAVTEEPEAAPEAATDTATDTVPDTAADEPAAESQAESAAEEAGETRERRPTGRRRIGGQPVPAGVDRPRGRHEREPVGRTARERVTGTADAPARAWWLTPAVLVLLAVVVGAAGFWFRGEAEHLTSTGAAQNRALVDSARTSEVNGQVKDALEKVLSYNYADTASTEKAAKDLLGGQAVDQYNQLYALVKQHAPEQKLVVTVKVVSSGVTRLEGDHATLLVYLDQALTRASDNQTSAGAAMMDVTADRGSGRWKITKLDMFGTPAGQ